jgi:DNA polymerase III delta subunit
LRKKVKLAYNLYRQCQDIGEANITLLSVLYSNAKALLQVQSCTSKDIAKSTGLTGFQIKLAKERMGHYKNRELVDMMKLIQKVERSIKTGEIEDAISIEYVLVNVL